MTNLRQVVDINRRFLRSVNIARDQKQPHGLEGYVITPLVQRTLAQIGDSIHEELADRAFTLTGPYGTGKSSFALLLYHLLRSPDDPAWEKLRLVNSALAEDLQLKIFGPKRAYKGFLVLPVTSRRASVAVLLAEAFAEVDGKLKERISTQIESLRACSDSGAAIRLVEEVASIAVSCGYHGLFFIFDEFGKVFEEAYFNKKNTDIFLLSPAN